MVTPAAGAVEFLNARGDRDVTLAARRMEPPSDAAAAIMANGGREPGVLAALPTEPQVTAPDPAAAAAVTPTPDGHARPDRALRTAAATTALGQG